METFNSEWWFEHLERMASALYEKADKELIFYKKSVFAAVKPMYRIRLKSVKTDIYGPNADPQKRIDRHKIVALYIQLFSENPVFVVKTPTNGSYPSIETVLVNEQYCLNMIRAILESWTKKTFDLKKFYTYRTSFMKLLANYRKSHTEAVNPLPNSYYEQIDKYPERFHFTHALAHLIFFIERDFMN